MIWLIFAFLPPLLWATSNHIDKYILSRYFKGDGVGAVTIFTGFVSAIFSLLVLIFSGENVLNFSLYNAVFIALNGMLLILAFMPYLYAVNEEDATVVVPLYQTIPIFSFVFGYFLLGETITGVQALAGLFIILGAIVVSLDVEKSFKIKMRPLLLMLLSSLLISIHFLVFKFIALQEDFFKTVFWEYVGATILAVVLLAFVKSYRMQFIRTIRENRGVVLMVNIVNESLNIGAKVLVNFASLYVPLVIINLANGFQPLFVFVIGILLTLFFPSISKESISKKHLVHRVIAVALILAGTYLLI